MCERQSGRGERAREGGESAAGGMLTGEAVQRAEREASRCTAHGKQQVRQRDRVNERREAERGDKWERARRERSTDSESSARVLVTVWTSQLPLRE